VIYPGAAGTEVWGINDNNQVVGAAFNKVNNSVGFALVAGQYKPLKYPGSKNSAAYDADNLGNVVGYYENSFGQKLGFLRTR
jgi:hypothetical protein